MSVSQLPSRGRTPGSEASRPATLADLLESLGRISPERVRLHPAPGTATEEDLLRACEEKPICELVDGVLVEKAVGFRESVLAAVLIKLIGVYLDAKDLGIVAGADGMLRLSPGLVRAPDVSFVSWDHLPGRKLPSRPIPDLYPDLAVEVLSRSNTREEMDRKLKEYFSAGTRLVWYVEPEKGVVRVYTSPTDVTTLTDADELDGASLLPGFRLSIRDWFAAARSGE